MWPEQARYSQNLRCLQEHRGRHHQPGNRIWILLAFPSDLDDEALERRLYPPVIVHWEIREQMTEQDAEIIVQRAKEKYPEARPRIIFDNGPQFIAKDFKEFIRLSGMTYV